MPNGEKDPNEATEPKGRITEPKPGPAGKADFIGAENPSVDTPTPFSGMREGGGGSSG